MKIINTYQAKTQLSKLLERVQKGETIVIANAGKPVAQLSPYQARDKIVFGVWSNKQNIKYKDEDLVGIDPDTQKMFYGND